MVINESTAYKRDYKKIIINKHMIKEKEKIENIKNIILSSNIPEIGNVTEKINLLNTIENNITIAFSSKYMMDALKAFDCEEIELMFNGEIRPIILKNPDSNDLIELIVPIRIG